MTADPARPLAIHYYPTETLIPYARNARTHSAAQIGQIAASIREFGFTNPLLIDADRTLIAGHGRLAAAQKLGMVTVPCIVLAGLSKAQQRALVLADNKLALNAGWDSGLLAVELQDLHAEGFRLDVIGFDAPELATLLGLDPAPAAPDPVTDESRFLLMAEFDTEADLEAAFHEAMERGWKAKVMS